MRIIIAFFIGFIISFRLQAQDISIYGKIEDVETKIPMPFVNIAIADLYKGTSSNINGKFLIKVDSLPVTLIFSHIGYNTKTVQVTSQEDLTISLIPGKLIMDELVIEENGENDYAAQLITKVYNKATNSARKWKYGLAYYRQSSKNADTYSELYEVFYDTRYSSQGIVDWEIQEGRYAMATGLDQKDFVYNKNFTLLTRIFTFFQPATEKFIMPINPDVAELYDLTVKELRNIENRKIIIIGFKARPEIDTPAIEGEVYIDIESYDIIKFTGKIINDNLDIIALSNKNGSWKNYVLAIEAAFKPGSEDLFLDYITLNQSFDYYLNDQYSHNVETKSFLTYYEYYEPERFKKLGGRLLRFNKSDRDLLNKIGYNKQFWENNPVVLRTPVEEDIISSFESKNAFGSIYLNDRNQIQLEEDDLASDPFIQDITINLNNSKIGNLGEKVYLHLDKSYYASSENIWFKAYIANIGTLLPSESSGVLYTDLVNPEGKVILHKRLPVTSDGANGNFELSDKLKTGKYRIRAYTNWMKNYDEAFFFDKEISIYNPSDIDEINRKGNPPKDFDIQFFPEGGNLIVGIPSQIAFKAIDDQGKDIDIKGKIINTSGKEVSEIKTRHNGMGSIFILPQPDEKLKAVIEYAGLKKEVYLPEPMEEGYNMTINNLRDKNIQVMVKGSPLYNDTEFYLLGQSRGVIYHRSKSRINNGSAIISIPKSKLPDGIFHITLFDMDQNPLCERLVFINNEQLINTDLLNNENTYNPREKINLSVKLTNQYGKPVKNIPVSVAITDANHLIKPNQAENIINYLLLTSDLRGTLANPDYYFMTDDRETKIALDLVMLTHGWTRFTWQKIKDRSIQETPYSHEFAINLTGKAFVEGTNNVLSNGYITLVSTNESFPGVWQSTSNNYGDFQFMRLNIPDSLSVITQSMDSKGNMTNVDLKINKLKSFPSLQRNFQKFPPEVNKNILAYMNIVNQRILIASSIKFDNKVLLKEVVVKGEKYDANIYGEPDAVIEIDENLQSFNNIFDMMNGRVPGLIITGSGMQAQVRIRGFSSILGDNTPLFLLDGVPLSSNSFGLGSDSTQQNTGGNMELNSVLLSLNPADIEKIDVLKNPGTTGIFGVRGANGVIAIYTRKGIDINKLTPSKGYGKISLQGYSWNREFYSPKYDVVSDKDVLTDKRTTLFWDPVIKTNNLGIAEFEFFNSDEAKSFQIEIEGISDFGEPIYFLETIGQIDK